MDEEPGTLRPTPWDVDEPAVEDRAAKAVRESVTFEAIKTHWRQTKEGVALTLNLNPAEVPPEIALAQVGQRFLCVLVALDSNEEPVKLSKARMAQANLTVQRAGMLCGNPDFQHWLCTNQLAQELSEEAAAEAVREFCGIASRRDLATDVNAARHFNRLVNAFTHGTPL